MAARAAKSFGVEFKADVSLSSLGVDFAAGGPRSGKGLGAVRKARLAKAKARSRRAGHISRVADLREEGKPKGSSKVAASRLFTAGVGPTGSYGMEVNGMDAQELHCHLRSIAAGFAPVASKAGLWMKLLLHGFPV